jgi:tetratricopeptide (TPR) repeat protein
VSPIEDLEYPVHRRLGRLALWPDLTAGTTAALLEMPVDAAGALLERLLQADVLDPLDDEHYRLYEPARDYIDDLAATLLPEDRTAALARTVNYYLLAAAAADHQVYPHPYRICWVYGRLASAPVFASRQAALAWLDAEVPQVVAAQKTAVSIRLAEPAWAFAETLEHWLESRRRHSIWRQVCRRGIAAAQRARNPRAEAAVTDLLARSFHDLGEHTRSLKLATRALTLAMGCGDQVGTARALSNLAALHLAGGRADEALSQLNAAVDLVREDPGCSWLLAMVSRQLGIANGMAGRMEQARAELRRALDIAAALGDDHQQGLALTDLGKAELNAGKAPAALAALDDALNILLVSGWPYPRARAHRLMAVTHRNLGETEAARRHIGWALQIYRDVGAATDHPDHALAAKAACALDVSVAAEGLRS